MANTGKVHPCEKAFDSAPPPPPRDPLVPARVYWYKVTSEPRLPEPATYTYRRNPGDDCNISACCSPCCISTIVGLVILMTIWLFIMLCTLRLPNLDVEGIHVSGLNTTSSAAINTTITSELMMRNPNQLMGMKYDHINMEVEVNGVTIGNGRISSFSQGHKSSSNLTFDSSSEDLTLKSDTIALLAMNLTNVPLHANVDFTANSKVGSMVLFTITMKVGCDLNVDLTRTSGSQLTQKQCKVDRWNI